jgi:hypothetical protein
MLNRDFANASENDFLIYNLSDHEPPACPCRAIVCGVSVEESDNKIERIIMQFLVVGPSFGEPVIIEWCSQNDDDQGGFVEVFNYLIDSSCAKNFYDMLGAVFDSELVYYAECDKIKSQLSLLDILVPPFALT